MRYATSLAAIALASLLTALPSATALAGQLPGPVADCPSGQGAAPPTATPWAQPALSFSSVWGLSTGGGVTVAVIDSGVDANPQFGSRVTIGPDLSGVVTGIPAGADCVGHGTAVASIIAAAAQHGVTFTGVAPRARILSIKVTNSEAIPGGVTATAIRDAVDLGASVINLSLADVNTPALQSAVQFAQAHNVVLVAAAGNDGNGGKGPFYPAAYPGVLSVGAVARDGSLASFSDTHTPVTVTAPGEDVASAYPGAYPDAYSLEDNGTSFATAFVSGVAALVRAYHPDLSAAQVVSRIAATADGAAGPGTGSGLVNPVQAVTAVLPETGAGPPASVARHVLVTRVAPPDTRPRTVAMAITAGAFGLVLVVLIAVTVIPAGRRRGWRADGA